MGHDPIHHYQNESVAGSYDETRFSSLSGRGFDALEKRFIRKAFRGLDRNSTLIDVPCGTGRLAEALLEEGFQVVGMDISEEMLAQARHKLARFGDRFSCRSVNMLECDSPPNARYDAALCARVLMHFPLEKQVVFLRNVAAMVSGPIVFTQSWVSPYQTMRRSVKRLLRHQAPVRYPLSRADLARLLQGAGLGERRRLRPCPPLTEEMIVIAERLSDNRSTRGG
jgi:2-polyprenyl-3-methyl-5-hydroxy-6-metoxy-1,4-benzoquinol methylase